MVVSLPRDTTIGGERVFVHLTRSFAEVKKVMAQAPNAAPELVGPDAASVWGIDSMDRLATMIRVLQQLQQLLPISARLADVAEILASIETEFGAERLLEDVIQHLVAEHIAAQLARRSSQRTRQVQELEVAA